jgi:hypothetical protein
MEIPMPYLVRCIGGTFTIAFTFRGALRVLRQAGRDAAVYSLFGRWIAGRVVAA